MAAVDPEDGIKAFIETTVVSENSHSRYGACCGEREPDAARGAKPAEGDACLPAKPTVTESVPPAKRDLVRDFEMGFAESEAAIRRDVASFDQLTSAINYIEAVPPIRPGEVDSLHWPVPRLHRT